MAQIGELLIALQGDSKSWSNSLDTAAKGLRKLVAESQKAGKDLSNFNAKTINLLKGWSNEVGDAYRTLDKSLQPVKQSLVDQGKALSVNQKGMSTLALESVVASEKMSVFNDSLKSVSSSLWLMSSGLQQFGRSMSIAFTAPIVAAATLATKSFADWEKGTVSIQRAAEITRKEADAITESFIKISQQIPITVEELQKAGYAAAQAGVTGEKAITNFAKAAVMLSKVGGDAFKALPVDDLANKLAKLGIAFGETGENWEEVNNLASSLLVVAKAVPGSLGEIVEAMRRTSGVAVTMGLSLADTTAAMGTLVAAGIPAARAGTEFSRILLEIAQNSEKVGQALGYTDEKMGEFEERIDTDMMGVLIELIDRYGQVEGRLDKMTHLQEIFGEISLKALLPLIDNADLLKDLMSRANQELESGALITAEFATEANSLSGTIQVFKNNLAALAEIIGRDLAPYINLFLQSAIMGLKNLIGWWRELNPHVKFAIFLFASLAAVIGPLALILNTVFLNPISGIVTFITFLSKANASLGLTAILSKAASGGVLTLGGAFAGIVPAIAGFTKALGVLLLGLGKILLIVGLIAGAVYMLGKALGIQIKLPKMPEIKMPKYGGGGFAGAGADRDVEAEAEAEAKADAKAAKTKEKALSKEMRDKKKIRDKEMRIIDSGIDDYEKIRKTEVKIRQKIVDDQKDALDAMKERWEDEKRIEDEKIRIQENSLDTAKDTLKAAKKELSKLKKIQDAELQVAENSVDLAEMNLDAAQDALATEVALGHDEFDLSYRLAVARVEAAEAALQAAREHVIAVEIANQEQIDAQEEIVEQAEELVDVQADALNDLKKALDERRAIVEKEVDLLDDELKIKQRALDDYKENTQEKLDMMRDEKSTRQDAWDEELSILQDQLDAARDLADEIGSMPIPELPDLAGTLGLLDDEMQKQMQEMQDTMRESMGMGIGAAEGSLLADYQDAWKGAQEIAEREGKSAGAIFVKAMWDSLVDTVAATVDEIFGQLVFGPNMDEARRMAENEGKTFSQLIWEGIKEWWATDIKGKFGPWLIENIIDPIRDILPELKQKGKDIIGNVAQGIWDGLNWVKDAINAIRGWPMDGLKPAVTDAKQRGKDIIGNVAQGIWDGLVWVRNAINSIGGWPMSGIGNIVNSAKNWGKDMIGNFAQGIWDGMSWVKDAVRNMADWIKGILHFSEPDFGPLKEMGNWGKDMIKTYTDGIKSEIPNLENTLNSISVEKNLGSVMGDVGNSLAGMASSGLPETKVDPAVAAPEVAPVNKNFYIQPGTMIATRGEIRNFVRLLKEYESFEEER